MKYHSALTSLLLSTVATTALARKNDKTNKNEFDACIFAFPTIAQTRDHHEESDQDPDTVNAFINHAIAVNKVFSGVVSGWVAETMTTEDISNAGYEAGEIHMDKLGNFLEEQVITAVCEMEGTCEYKKCYSAYANVAANFMYGFGVGEGFGTSVNIIECEGDDGNAFGDDFFDRIDY